MIQTINPSKFTTDQIPNPQEPTEINEAALLCVGTLTDAVPVNVFELEEATLLVNALAPFGTAPVGVVALCWLNETPGWTGP